MIDRELKSQLEANGRRLDRAIKAGEYMVSDEIVLRESVKRAPAHSAPASTPSTPALINQLKHRTALVTGDAGFVGRHVARELAEDGWAVVGCDIKNGLDARVELPAIGTRFDLVVHCAAVVGGRATIEGQPLKVSYDFGLDSDVIQFCARTRPKRVVLMSSSAAYPTKLQQLGQRTRLAEHMIDLDDIRTPDAIYGLTKIALEAQARELLKLGVGVTVVRPASGYGPDQDLDYPWPSFLQRAMARDEWFDVWGDGTQVRDWLHVDDLARMIITLVNAHIDGPVNLSTGVPTSFNQLAHEMCSALGYVPKLRYHPDKPTGVHYRVLSPHLISQVCPATISVRRGIRMALEGANA